ncbi:transcriptional activator Myb [Favolaschia claudopus]|uniref:Transcriptional activator Myb n=1 Tax=Favolaschia claudopus TaxID=2862362 RepID=A0AAW0EIW3_9AGAR
MAQRTVLESRWTAQEDAQLTAAVRNFGDTENWKTVALAVPGRSNKACRKRWLHSLSPSVKKSAWTPFEDSRLIELYETHGPKWSAIARQIHGRTDDACSKRYRESLDPKLKKDEWTPEEDTQLTQVYNRLGGKWGQVGQELQRSGLGCRNRWRSLERNRVRSLQAPPPPPPLPVDEPEFLQESLTPAEMGIWPYYPPEAYHSFLAGEELMLASPSFRVATPRMPETPKVPPFNFASSSLSAALSDPPPTSMPLPPVPEEEPPNADQDLEFDFPAFASTSHSPPRPPEPPDPIPYTLQTISPAQLTLRPPRVETVPAIVRPPSPRAAEYRSPVISDTSSPRWRSPNIFSSANSSLPDEHRASPPILFDHASPATSAGQDPESSSPSPFVPPSSLSPTDSPIPCPDMELPPIETLPVNSLLFSSSPYYRLAPSKREKRSRIRKPPKALGETRLSSLLPLSTDLSVRAYACGRHPCWSSHGQMESTCFATSKDLLEHRKQVHGEGGESPDDRPYRCALLGCGKSWKTLNGLQYHLQISTAHFRNALSSSFKSSAAEDGDMPVPSSQEAEDGEEDDRIYKCHHPRCFKAYKQPSGLRYHLIKGHPPSAQLETVPPTLAREITKKTSKMRRKDSAEDFSQQQDEILEDV